jgi:hypothetical protein
MLHFLIMLSYMAFTSYLFVYYYKDANPIGVGAQQWLFVIGHIIVTCIVAVVQMIKVKRERRAGQTLLIGLIAIVFWMTLYSIFFEPKLWDYMWKLRGQ